MFKKILKKLIGNHQNAAKTLINQNPNLENAPQIIKQIEEKNQTIKVKYKGNILYFNNDNATLYHIGHSIQKMEILANSINLSPDNSEYVYDVGANTGLFSFFILKRYPKANAFLFEADDSLNEFINLTLAPFKGRFKIINKAVSNKDNTLQNFYININSRQTNSLHSEAVAPFTTPDNIKVKTVDSITLDAYSNIQKHTYISILKFDIQGAEYEALQGASKLLQSTKYVLMEACFLMPNTIESLTLINQYFKQYKPVNEIIMGADLLFFN